MRTAENKILSLSRAVRIGCFPNVRIPAKSVRPSGVPVDVGLSVPSDAGQSGRRWDSIDDEAGTGDTLL